MKTHDTFSLNIIVAQMGDVITSLQDKVATLENKFNDFEKLSKVDNINVPVDAPIFNSREFVPYQKNPGWNDNVTKCPKCGIDLTKVMSYCCNVPNCPTGMGGVYSSFLGGIKNC